MLGSFELAILAIGLLALFLVFLWMMVERMMAIEEEERRSLGDYIGWVRTGWKKWVPVVQGPDELTCRQRLEEWWDDNLLEGRLDEDAEKVVLAAGVLPDETRKIKRRRR